MKSTRLLLLIAGLCALLTLPVAAQQVPNPTPAPKAPAKTPEQKAHDLEVFMQRGVAQLPPGSAHYLNLTYVDGAKPGIDPNSSQTLDLFVPPGDGPFPLVINIHGGGWHAGGKEGGVGLAKLAIPKGMALASICYRWIQDAPFPAQINDCNAALIYLRQHAAQYNLDPNRVGVTGHSAGAHLAALMAVTGDGDQFAKNPPVSVRVQAAVCLSGPFDLDRDRGQWPKTSFVWNPRDAFWPFFPNKTYDPVFAQMASPTSYVHPGIPPMLVISGGKDTLVPVDQARVFVDKLKKAGVDATFVLDPDHGHGLNGGVTQEQDIEFLAHILNGLPPSPK